MIRKDISKKIIIIISTLLLFACSGSRFTYDPMAELYKKEKFKADFEVTHNHCVLFSYIGSVEKVKNVTFVKRIFENVSGEFYMHYVKLSPFDSTLDVIAGDYFLRVPFKKINSNKKIVWDKEHNIGIASSNGNVYLASSVFDANSCFHTLNPNGRHYAPDWGFYADSDGKRFTKKHFVELERL